MRQQNGLTTLGQQARRILAVDDDAATRAVLRFSLEAAGFEVGLAGNAQEAHDWLSRNGLPHLAVVDILMPGTDGIELCREVQKLCDLPVIMLTAVDEKTTVTRVIEEVAEDYVTKPFDPGELVARVRRVLRRMDGFGHVVDSQVRVDKRLTIDIFHQRAEIEGKEVPLTPTESRLLHILMRNRQRTVRTEYLLSRLWPREEVFEPTLRVHVHRLRQKLEPDPKSPRYLLTHRGRGYRFLAD